MYSISPSPFINWKVKIEARNCWRLKMHCVSSGKTFGVKTWGMVLDLEKKVEKERKTFLSIAVSTNLK